MTTTTAQTNKTTRVGRKVVIPRRFIENLGEMVHHCGECGAEYASKRNLKRHVNSVHSNNVKYVPCTESNCDRIFLRREYLSIHLTSTHELSQSEAKERLRKSGFEYTDRENIESFGLQEKKLKMNISSTISTPKENEEPAEPQPQAPNQDVQENEPANQDILIVQEDASEFDEEREAEGAVGVDEVYVTDDKDEKNNREYVDADQ